jgi:hypothetical protein
MLTKEHRRLGGTCTLCGHALTRAGAGRHLAACAPAHDRTTGAETRLLQLRVTSPGLPAYWLDLEMRVDAKLDALDSLLRRTWLECGHLSSFSIGRVTYFSPGYDFEFTAPFRGSAFGGGRSERSMAIKAGDALSAIGERFRYEYDFGSTTTLQILVSAQRIGRLGRLATRVLARNVAPTWPCATCGQPATTVCSFCLFQDDPAFTCRLHKAEHACGDTDGFMPVVNSPRMGVCGYGVTA